MNNKRKTLIALFLLIFIINNLVHSVSSQENKTKEILLQEGVTPYQNATFSESPQESEVAIETERSLDRSLRILSTVVTAIGVLVTLLSVFFAIGSALGIYGFFQIKKWDEYKKNIDEKIEAIIKGAAAIEENRNTAEKNVGILRVEIEKSIPHLLTEEPTAKSKGKLSELAVKLELLRVYGGSLKPEDHFYRGYFLFYDKQYDLALKDFEAAIDLNSDYFEAWFFKGAILTNSGYYEKALKVFDKAIEKKPDSAEAWCFKGVALENLKLANEALEAYEKALGFKPEYTEAWYNKGAVLSSKGQYDEAIKAYENAIKLKPNYAGALYDIARAYSIKGKTEMALHNLKKATEIVRSYRDKAKENKDFEKLWDNEYFKKLIE